jgi:hypothetical protein
MAGALCAPAAAVTITAGNVETRMRSPGSCKLPISISFASSPLVGPVGHSVIPTPIRSWRCSGSWNICREEPVFAGKVTCGVRNETSGQKLAVKYCCHGPFTGQNRNSKCGSGIQHTRLGGWRSKTMYFPFQTLRYIGMAARGVLSSLTFLPITGDKGPSAPAMDVGWRVCQQLPDCRLANLDRWTGEIALPRELGALDGPVLQ